MNNKWNTTIQNTYEGILDKREYGYSRSPSCARVQSRGIRALGGGCRRVFDYFSWFSVGNYLLEISSYFELRVKHNWMGKVSRSVYSGVFTFIHPIGQNVYLESVKHTVQPGNADQIAMKKVWINNCYFFHWTRTNCTHTAQLMLVELVKLK